MRSPRFTIPRVMVLAVIAVLLSGVSLLWLLAMASWMQGYVQFEPWTVVLGLIVGPLWWLFLRLVRTKGRAQGGEAGGATERQARRLRWVILERVKDTWIRQFLKPSLPGVPPTDLELVDRPDAVAFPRGKLGAFRPGESIPDVFKSTGGALLVLGEPGSGKTTMLLELVRQAIARAENSSDDYPIPVYFSLSSWADGQQPISQWVVDELARPEGYDVPSRTARAWVENDGLLLVLDGLDTVPREKQEACVKAINHFRRGRSLTPVLVSCRTADYESLQTLLNLRSAVELQPLTWEQIIRYLAAAYPDETVNPPLERLAVTRTLERDERLLELAQYPLMLRVITLAFSKISTEELSALESLDARRRYIFRTYVTHMLEQRGDEERYTSEDSVRWLAWLARQMTDHSQEAFAPEGIQPSWLPSRVQMRLQTVSYVLAGVLAVIAGIGVGLGSLMVFRSAGSYQNAPDSWVWWGFGLLCTFPTQLGAGWIVFLILRDRWSGLLSVKPVERLGWSWGTTRRYSGLALWMLIITVLSMGMMVLLTGQNLRDILGQFSGTTIVGIMAYVVVIYGPAMLVLTLFELPRRIAHRKLRTTRSPNLGIRRSGLNCLLLSVTVGLVVFLCCLSSTLAYGWAAGVQPTEISYLLLSLIAGGLTAGLAFGLTIGGGSAVINHLVLRYLLYRNGTIPWHWVTFLDYAADLVLLRRVGGDYLFFHPLLQAYFAALDR